MEVIIMALKEQLEHAAAVTKWKADQQVRILKIQSQISDVENTVKGRVYALGESTLRLSQQGELQHPKLLELAAEIARLKEQQLVLQQTLTAIKAEGGPQLFQPQQSFSGLVCPECGAILKGNFCPEHGVAGVPPATTAPVPTTISSQGYLACPVCSQRLNGKFCPVHGVEGVWVEPTPPTPSSPNSWPDPKLETPSVSPGGESQQASWSTHNPVPPESPQQDQPSNVDHENL